MRTAFDIRSQSSFMIMIKVKGKIFRTRQILAWYPVQIRWESLEKKGTLGPAQGLMVFKIESSFCLYILKIYQVTTRSDRLCLLVASSNLLCSSVGWYMWHMHIYVHTYTCMHMYIRCLFIKHLCIDIQRAYSRDLYMEIKYIF